MIGTELPEAIRRAADDPLGEVVAQASDRRPLVAIIGPGLPDALVLAAGGRPLRVRVGDEQTPLADQLVPSEARQLKIWAEPALDGRLSAASLLVVTRAHEWLYYTLKEAVRIGFGAVPPLHLHDLVPSAGPGMARYNRVQLERTLTALARAIGTAAVDDTVLAAAMADVANRDARLCAVQALRDEGRLAGSDALRIVVASRVLDPAAFVAAIDPWLSSASTTAAGSGPRLLLLASDVADLAAVHAAAERAGATIVAEDSEWGSRAAGAPPALGGDLLGSLLDATVAASSGPEVQPRAARLGWAQDQMARADVSGVVFAIPPVDRRFGWDYPALRDHAAALGKPALLLRADAVREADAARAALADFAAALSERGDAA